MTVKTATLNHLDILGADVDADGEEVGQLYEQAAGACAAQLEEPAFVAIEGASDDADCASEHCRRYLVGAVIAWTVGRIYRTHEALHLFVGHGHVAVVVIAHKAVTQCWRGLDDGREHRQRGTREEQVLHHGHQLPPPFSSLREYAFVHGRETHNPTHGKQLVGRQLGVHRLHVA